MALKMEEKTIDGVNYTISQIGATRSVKLLARLGRVFGPALARVFAVVEKVDPTKSIKEQEIDLVAAGAVFQSLFSSLDDAEIDGLLRELFANVAATGSVEACGFLGAFEGDLKKIDAHFGGRVDALFRVAFASLEVNYGSFFGVVAAIVGKNPAIAAALGASRSAGSST